MSLLVDVLVNDEKWKTVQPKKRKSYRILSFGRRSIQAELVRSNVKSVVVRLLHDGRTIKRKRGRDLA